MMSYNLEQFDAYLGDGVYASFDGYQIWLAVNSPDNKAVALEPDVFDRLVGYKQTLETELKALSNANNVHNI
jgi:hypothetical protein